MGNKTRDLLSRWRLRGRVNRGTDSITFLQTFLILHISLEKSVQVFEAKCVPVFERRVEKVTHVKAQQKWLVHATQRRVQIHSRSTPEWDPSPCLKRNQWESERSNFPDTPHRHTCPTLGTKPGLRPCEVRSWPSTSPHSTFNL